MVQKVLDGLGSLAREALAEDAREMASTSEGPTPDGEGVDTDVDPLLEPTRERVLPSPEALNLRDEIATRLASRGIDHGTEILRDENGDELVVVRIKQGRIYTERVEPGRLWRGIKVGDHVRVKLPLGAVEKALIGSVLIVTARGGTGYAICRSPMDPGERWALHPEALEVIKDPLR